jgi:hypothetical protein
MNDSRITKARPKLRAMQNTAAAAHPSLSVTLSRRARHV